MKTLFLTLLLGSLFSCSTKQVKPKEPTVNMEIVEKIHSKSNGYDLYTTILVDTNTNILYMQIETSSGHSMGITPVIDSDETYKTLKEKDK